MRVVPASLGVIIVFAIAAWLALVPGAWIDSDDFANLHVGDRYVYNVTNPDGSYQDDVEITLREQTSGSLVVVYANDDPWVERIDLDSGRVRYQERACYLGDCSREQRFYTSTGKPGLLGASAFLTERFPRVGENSLVKFKHRGVVATQTFTAEDAREDCIHLKPVDAMGTLPLMRWYGAGTPWQALETEFCPTSPMPTAITTGGYRFRLDTYEAGDGPVVVFGTRSIEFAPPAPLESRATRKDSLPPEGSTPANATSFHEALEWGRANDSRLRRYLAEHPAYNLRHAFKSQKASGSGPATPVINAYGLDVFTWDFGLQDSLSDDGYVFRFEERIDRFAIAHETRAFTVLESAPRVWEPSLDLDRLPANLVPLSEAANLATHAFEGWRRSQIGITSVWFSGAVDSYRAHEDFYAYVFRYSSVREPSGMGFLFELYVDATTGEILMIDGPVDTVAKLAAMGSA